MKHYLLIALCLCMGVQSRAYHNLIVNNPQQAGGKRTLGIITEPVVEITPVGIYAQVDLTFSINAEQSYLAKDSLEAVLKFDLPANSFINDSWLWLDNVTVVKANLIEKNRAISIYEGIVKRRRDPSLLIKTGAYSYQLNVYPMTTSFARKVKLSYSVPMNWLEEYVSVPLPLELISTSATVPDLTIKVNYDTRYNTPRFTNLNFSSYLQSSTASQQTFLIPAAAYKNVATLDVKYNINTTNGVFIGTFSPSNGDSYYQMVIQPSASATNKHKNIVFAVSVNGGDMYSYDQAVQYVKTSLHNNYNKADSFNLFLFTNKGLYKAFNSWQHVDSANIENAIPQASLAVIGNFDNFLKQSLAFAKTKPNDAQVILISDQVQYATSQSTVDAAFSSLKNFVGNFTNKVNVINLSTQYYGTTLGTIVGDELFFNKLTLATGGVYHASKTQVGESIGYKYKYYYDLNLGNILKELSALVGDHTGAYSVDVNISNGFAYNKFEAGGSNRFNLAGPYIETGKYYGTITQSTGISVQVSTPAGYINYQPTIAALDYGGTSYAQTWVNKYITSLEGYNNSAFAKEIIDSSINNRVLCSYTAFLAVETSDTIKAQSQMITSVPRIKESAAAIECYPNPFTDRVTIQTEFEMDRIDIVDLTGRKVFSITFTGKQKKFVWDGTDEQGYAVAAGFYIVKLTSGENTQTLKILKQ